MKNNYGEVVKPQYEVTLKKVSSMRTDVEQAIIDADFETYGYMSADNYRDAVRQAKDISKMIGQVVAGGYGTDILREVDIVCFFEDDISTYNVAWEEEYKNGKKIGRFEFD